MKGSSIHPVSRNLLKQAGAAFLVFILVWMQIPDALWQELHTHEHHDCGLPNVVHQYTPDCTLEQRFIQPWNDLVKSSVIFIPNSLFLLIKVKYVSVFYSSLIIIHHNKAPPYKLA